MLGALRERVPTHSVSGEPASATTHDRLAGVGQPQQTEHGDGADLAEDGETVKQKRHDSADDRRFDQINQTHTTFSRNVRRVSHGKSPRTAGRSAVLANNNLRLFLPLQALSVYRVIFPGLNPKGWKNLSVLALSFQAGEIRK
jgi:hypothetical protein